MRLILRLIAGTGAALSLIPAMLFFAGLLDQEVLKDLMTAGMILWFVGAAPFYRK